MAVGSGEHGWSQAAARDDTGTGCQLAATPCTDQRSLRVGIAGCGYWGSKHVRVLSELTRVGAVAVVDPNPQSREAVIAAFPAVRAFPDLDAALPHIDALIIAVPARSHAEVALEALRHGVHVLVEKPLTTSLRDARLVLGEACRSHAVLMVGHVYEFDSAVRDLRKRLDRGDFGDVSYLQSARLNLDLYRSDVNVVWDLASHDISIFNYLLSSVPDGVTAWGVSHTSSAMEDLAFVRLDYGARGTTAYVHLSWRGFHKVRLLTVVGSRKIAVYDGLVGERLRIFDRDAKELANAVSSSEPPTSYRCGGITSPHLPLEEPLVLEDKHFVDCILNGSVPMTDGRDGLRVVAVLEAIDQSMRTGRTIKVAYPPECGEMPEGQEGQLAATAV